MAQGKKPSHSVFYSRSRGNNQKDVLIQIGAAFAHESGKGFGLTIDVPLVLEPGARLVLLEPKKDIAEQAGEPVAY